MRIIAIYPALNGYICDVGCQKIVFDNRAHLLDGLRRYLENPKDVEHEFLKNAVNPMCDQAPPPDHVGEGIYAALNRMTAEPPATGLNPCENHNAEPRRR